PLALGAQRRHERAKGKDPLPQRAALLRRGLGGAATVSGGGIGMRYGLKDFPALLATPVGRRRLREGARYHAWPLYASAARLYRRTLIRDTRLAAVVGSFGKS